MTLGRCPLSIFCSRGTPPPGGRPIKGLIKGVIKGVPLMDRAEGVAHQLTTETIKPVLEFKNNYFAEM